MTLQLRPNRFWFLSFVFVSSLAFTPSADAATILALDDPSTPGLDMVFDDADLDGIVTTGGFISVGSFPASLTIGVGNLAASRLDLGAISGSFAEGATLNVLLTQTDYTGDGTAFSSILGSTDGSIVYGSYYDPTNTAFGMTNLIGSTLFFGPGPIVGTTSELLQIAGPYSVTQAFSLTHPAGEPSVSQFGASVQVVPAVPEPATMTLFGLGLSGVAFVRRRRARSN